MLRNIRNALVTAVVASLGLTGLSYAFTGSFNPLSASHDQPITVQPADDYAGGGTGTLSPRPETNKESDGSTVKCDQSVLDFIPCKITGDEGDFVSPKEGDKPPLTGLDGKDSGGSGGGGSASGDDGGPSGGDGHDSSGTGGSGGSASGGDGHDSSGTGGGSASGGDGGASGGSGN